MSLSSVRYALMMSLLAASAGCRSNERAPAADSAAGATPATSTAAADSAGTATTPTGQAMGGMHQDTLAARVEAHLGRLASSDPDSLRALVPVDREIVTTLIADCERMMRQMKMHPPRKWRTAVRDLRLDLDRMASLSDAQLQQAMPQRRKRIEGMLAMRHDMMRM